MAVSTLVDNTGTSGYARASWSLSPITDHYSYRLYLRPDGAPAWTLLYEDQSATGTGLYDIYQFSNSLQEVTLVEVTQDGTGEITEGTYANVNTFTPSGDATYWLVHPSNQSLTLQLKRVTADSFVEEIEHQVVNLLGRGRKINLGERWGITGSLTVQLMDDSQGSARAQRLELQSLADAGSAMFLRTPFGDMWKVLISNISFDRTAGTGLSEVLNVSFNYTEVA